MKEKAKREREREKTKHRKGESNPQQLTHFTDTRQLETTEDE